MRVDSSLGTLAHAAKACAVVACTALLLSTASTVRAGDFVSAPATPAGPTPQAVVIHDLNGDGKADVVVADYTAFTLNVFLGNGDGTLQAAAPIFLGTNFYPNGIAVGDVNGDGRLDLLVTGSGLGQMAVLLGNGDGTFVLHAVVNGVGAGPVAVELADLNGDGHLDAVVANFTSRSVRVLSGDGAGGF